MKTGSKVGQYAQHAQKRLGLFNKKIGNIGRSAIAGAAGAAVVLGNVGSSMQKKATELKEQAGRNNKKKNEEGFHMKKSTGVALLVALATVAGVLGALYFYVLRRERELDEYEQLLFSEDFNDDMLDDEPVLAAEDEA